MANAHHLSSDPTEHTGTGIESTFTMSRVDRSKNRDLHLFNDEGTLLGGLIVTTGITNSNLYAMVKVLVLFDAEFTLHLADNVVAKDNEQILPGSYLIRSPKPFTLTDEVPLTRTISLATGTRTQTFREAVRLRDMRCVVTNEEVVDDDWEGIEAAHIFPLAYEGIWKNQNFSRWISIPPAAGGLINSVQNGLSLRSDIHAKFDVYSFSINPDDDYKLVFFSRRYKELHGKKLDRKLLDSPERPVDQLLRWHFRQAVLANMKGTGEPVFELDFPPGSDIMGSILEGPKASERLQFELTTRLAAHFDVLEHEV